MNTLAQLPPRVGIAAFPAPSYGAPQSLEKPSQRRGLDSNGNSYVYGRPMPGRYAHSLHWKKLPLIQKDGLITFIAISQGERYDVVWTDHLGANRTVRIIGEFAWTQNSPRTCRATLQLEETYHGVLIDENGETLLDENGTEITW